LEVRNIDRLVACKDSVIDGLNCTQQSNKGTEVKVMTEVEDLAAFVERVRFDDMSATAVEQLKIRVLDTIGVAIGALDAPPVAAIRELIAELGAIAVVRDLIAGLGGHSLSTLIGGGKTAPDRAAFYNGALTRYLDLMDSYIATGEACHPSDNLGAVLATAEMVRANGAEFLTALAVAYQIQTRLSDVAPVRGKGFDHTTLGAYAVAAGVAKALRLPREQIANAIAISGTANNALNVSYTGRLSHWKGLAYPNTAMAATHAALLAAHGITGPEAVFEGFKDTISGPFEIDWSKEDLERVKLTNLKKHNAEIHVQSAIDTALDIHARPGFLPSSVRAIRLETFADTHQIFGGGEEHEKRIVRTKEDADHSWPYILAIALIDGQVQSEQFNQSRITASDVQELLRKVSIVPVASLTALFPERFPARLEVTLQGGEVLRVATDDYHGFHTDPFDWSDARVKFDRVTRDFLATHERDAIANAISNIDERPVAELTALLGAVRAHAIA
jgi:2-methylcitrate dehydratase